MKVLQATKYTINPDTGCWEWNGYCDKYGYGRMYYKGKKAALSHRVAYLEYYGELDANLFVLHSCDNPCCINPEHLRQGTPRDNTKDMIVRGRRGSPKPEPNQVIHTFIHQEHGKFVGRMIDLYKKYQLNQGNVHKVVTGVKPSVKGWRLANAASKSK